MIDSYGKLTLVIKDGEIEIKDFKVDKMPAGVDLDLVIRDLVNLSKVMIQNCPHDFGYYSEKLRGWKVEVYK